MGDDISKVIDTQVIEGDEPVVEPNTEPSTVPATDPNVDPATEPEGGTDPTGGELDRDLKKDAYYAEQRRAQENAELKSQLDRTRNLLGAFYEGENLQEMLDNLEADISDTDVEDVTGRREAEEQNQNLQMAYDELADAYITSQAEMQMEKDLSAIQAVDPTVKSLDDLGETFLGYIGAGLSAEDAYFATKFKESKTKATPPAKVGAVSHNEDKTYFTLEEVQKMSVEEERKYHDIIVESMKKWR